MENGNVTEIRRTAQRIYQRCSQQCRDKRIDYHLQSSVAVNSRNRNCNTRDKRSRFAFRRQVSSERYHLNYLLENGEKSILYIIIEEKY